MTLEPDALEVHKVDGDFILISDRDRDQPYPPRSGAYKSTAYHCLFGLACDIVEHVMRIDCSVEDVAGGGVVITKDPSGYYGSKEFAEYRIRPNRWLTAQTIQKFGFTLAP